MTPAIFCIRAVFLSRVRRYDATEHLHISERNDRLANTQALLETYARVRDRVPRHMHTSVAGADIETVWRLLPVTKWVLLADEPCEVVTRRSVDGTPHLFGNMPGEPVAVACMRVRRFVESQLGEGIWVPHTSLGHYRAVDSRS